MSAINLETNIAQTMLSGLQGADAKGATVNGADSTKVKEIVSKTLEILAGTNVKVTRGDSTGVDGAAEKKTSGATSTPVLDNPDDAKAVEANLEKLIAFLQLDNEERQAAMAKDRIKAQKDSLDTEQKDRMKKIDENIKQVDKAEKARKASRLFGWLGAIIAVITAIVVTVVTGGAAAAFAIAGAALAVASLVGNETGLTDKLIDKLAESLEKNGDSKNDAKFKASLIVNLTMLGLSLACGIGAIATAATAAANAATQAVKTISETAKMVQSITTIASTVVGTGSLAAGGVSTYFNYTSQNAQADVTELEKFMQMLQQRLEESEEELQQILSMIQNAVGKIAELINSATDTSTEISQNIGAMA